MWELIERSSCCAVWPAKGLVASRQISWESQIWKVVVIASGRGEKKKGISRFSRCYIVWFANRNFGLIYIVFLQFFFFFSSCCCFTCLNIFDENHRFWHQVHTPLVFPLHLPPPFTPLQILRMKLLCRLSLKWS